MANERLISGKNNPENLQRKPVRKKKSRKTRQPKRTNKLKKEMENAKRLV